MLRLFDKLIELCSEFVEVVEMSGFILSFNFDHLLRNQNRLIVLLCGWTNMKTGTSFWRACFVNI